MEQPPVEEPPMEQPPMEQPPVEEPPMEQPPVEEPPMDDHHDDWHEDHWHDDHWHIPDIVVDLFCNPSPVCPPGGFCLPGPITTPGVVIIEQPIGVPELGAPVVETPNDQAPALPKVENGDEVTLFLDEAEEEQGRAVLVVGDRVMLIDITDWQPQAVTVQLPTLLLTEDTLVQLFVGNTDGEVLLAVEVVLTVAE